MKLTRYHGKMDEKKYMNAWPFRASVYFYCSMTISHYQSSARGRSVVRVCIQMALAGCRIKTHNVILERKFSKDLT